MLGHLLPITSLPITYEQLNNLVPIKFCTAIKAENQLIKNYLKFGL